MKIATVVLMLMAMLTTGCAQTTVITKPSGEVWTVKQSADAFVTYEGNGVLVQIDNRGRESVLEGLLKLTGAKYLGDTNLAGE